MINFDNEWKTLGFVMALAVLAEPSIRRREAERRRRMEEEKRKRERLEKERREKARRRAEERAKQPASPPQPEAQRFPDEAYEHYRKHGYWRGTGGGAWTSSKHPDDWEHCHLK